MLDLKEQLSSLGYILRDDGKAWRARAVYRNGKNSNSMLIYKNSGVWSDYGTGAYSQPFGKLLELHGIKNQEQIPYVSQEVIKEIEESQIEKVYPESILSKLIPHHKFYTEKGIPLECLQRLKCGMAMAGKMYQRYVFPIYNLQNQIIGFSGRYLGNNPDRPKWKHLGKKKNWCYPLYVKDKDGNFFAQDAILKTKEVIIVESIGDMMALHSRGIFNVVVAFGVALSEQLMCAILALDPEKIFLSFNNDEAKGEDDNTGKIACINNFLILLNYFDFNAIGMALPIKKDFGEMNDVDFKEWIRIKDSTDYNDQRVRICELAENLKNSGRISKKALSNLRRLCD